MSTMINGYSPNSYLNVNTNYGNNAALSNYSSINNMSGSIFGTNMNTNSYNTAINNQTTMPQQDDGSAGMLQMLMQLVIALVSQKTGSNNEESINEQTIIDEGDTIINNETPAAAEPEKKDNVGRAAKAAATGGLSEIFHF